MMKHGKKARRWIQRNSRCAGENAGRRYAADINVLLLIDRNTVAVYVAIRPAQISCIEKISAAVQFRHKGTLIKLARRLRQTGRRRLRLKGIRVGGKVRSA